MQTTNKKNMKYKHRIVIGDWSKDGHEQSEFFTFQCTHDQPEIKKAYLAACKKCKVSLHYQDHKHPSRMKGITPVCGRYEDSSIPAPQLQALKDLGVNLDFRETEFHQNNDGKDELCCSPQDIANLFFAMVKTQIPGLEYKMVEENKPINGFWSEDFNFSFGYGCFGG
jgi:hypothetical protein